MTDMNPNEAILNQINSKIEVYDAGFLLDESEGVIKTICDALTNILSWSVSDFAF